MSKCVRYNRLKNIKICVLYFIHSLMTFLKQVRTFWSSSSGMSITKLLDFVWYSFHRKENVHVLFSVFTVKKTVMFFFFFSIHRKQNVHVISFSVKNNYWNEFEWIFYLGGIGSFTCIMDNVYYVGKLECITIKKYNWTYYV